MAILHSTKNTVFGRNNVSRFLTTTALTAAGVLALSNAAKADNWGDHIYDVGNVDVDVSVPDTTNLTQTTDFVKARGDGDITAGHTVNVFQPGSGSKYVLYDIENDPTQIMGALNANGQIFIFDQNGVIFGANSSVNVGSIVTSTGFISDEDLLDNDGKYVFQDVDGVGAITLNGSITVADAGLAAFVAPTVINNGVINAKMGKVAFAAGDRVTLDLYGDDLVEIALDDKASDALLENSGTINAEGGTIALSAQAAKSAVDNVINVSGVINASSATVKGGKIILGGGDAGTVEVSGALDASGTDGGSINVTGDNVNVADTATLTADGGKGDNQQGNGGRIDVIANTHADFRGLLASRGGANGGNGGNAEVSGYEYLGFEGLADLSAANGETGNLLMDPAFAVIHSGVLHNPLGAGYVLSAQALANSMELANITVQADNFIDVGTQNNAYNTGNAAVDAILNGLVGTGDINLSTFDYDTLNTHGSIFPWNWTLDNHTGTTSGGITLESNTVNFNKDVIMGDGDLAVDAANVNLNSRIYDKDGVTALGDARLSSNAGTVNVISNNALIQQGVWLANDAGGATVNVGDGTYNENVLINKSLTLSGTGTTNTTIIDGTGLTGDGVTVAADNVSLNGFIVENFNTSYLASGVFVDSAISNLSMNDVLSRNNKVGFFVTDSGSINGLDVDDSGFDNNDFGWYTMKDMSVLNASDTVENVTVDNTTFSGNKFKGIYAEKLSDATFTDIDVIGSAYDVANPNANVAVEVNLKNGTYQNIVFDNATIYSGSPTTSGNKAGVGISIKARNDGPTYSAKPASLTNAVVKNSTIDVTGGDIAVALSHNIDGATVENNTLTGPQGVSVFNGASNITVADNTINATGVSSASIDGSPVSATHGVAFTNAGGANVIRDNTITSSDDGVIVNNTSALIEGNTIAGPDINDDTKNGIFILDGNTGTSETVQVLKNTITGFGEGIDIRNATTVSIMNNFINDNFIGLNTVAPVDGSLITVYDNNFEGNDTLIKNLSGETINASFNWWGTTDEATIASNMTGPVDFSPYQGEGIDTDLVTKGYQGNMGNLHVTTLGSQTSGLIQEAIDGANDNGTVTVNAGTYTENLMVDVLGLKLAGLSGAILNYDVANSGRGVAGNLITIGASDVNIDPFIFDGGGFATYGINSDGFNNVIVDGNLFKNFLGDAIRISNGTGIEVINNIIGYEDLAATTLGTAGNIGGDGIRLDNTDGAVVKSNTIAQTMGPGAIEVLNSDGVMVGGVNSSDANTLSQIGKNGIRVEGGTENKVYRNSINTTGVGGNLDGLNGAGVYVKDSSNADIFRNSIGTGSGVIKGDGILLVGSNGALVTRNTIDDTTSTLSDFGNGIHVINSDDVVIGGAGNLRNTITDADWDGIRVANGSDNITIDNNKIDGVDKSGIYLGFVDTANVKLNDIDDANTGFGIHVDGGDHITIDDNDIDDVAQDGIYADTVATAGLVIKNNDIGTHDGDIGDNGIEVQTSHSAIITGNETNDTGANGIYVNASNDVEIGGTTDALGNTISRAGANGIFVNGGSSALIQYNKVRGTNASFGSDGTAGAQLDGILVVNNDDVDVLNNTIAAGQGFEIFGLGWSGGNGAKQHGINVISSNSAVIDQNNVIGDLLGSGIGAGVDGIHVVGSNLLTIGGLIPVASGNKIFSTGRDGIYVDGSMGALVLNNIVGGVPLMDVAGDGIDMQNTLGTLVAGNIITDVGGDGIEFSEGLLSAIGLNFITGAGDDGIDIRNSALFAVGLNQINGAADNGIQMFNTHLGLVGWNTIDGSGNDGIRDRFGSFKLITENDVTNSGDDGIDAGLVAFTDITNNTVDGAGDDGIQLFLSAFSNIKDNEISNVNDDGIDITLTAFTGITDNKVTGAGDDGIHVEGGERLTIDGNTIWDNFFGDGIDITGVDGFIITNNLITNSGDNGVEIADSTDGLMEANTIEDAANSGIELDNVDGIDIASNLINNSGVNGLWAKGGDNGSIILRNNTFNDNPIGALFQSGQIDLTGAANTFNGGDVALRFDLFNAGAPLSLRLVGDTIGNTIFNGQTTFYAELLNGALFQPGTPTIINGLNATYDGFRPADFGGVLTLAQYQALESKIWHFNDDPTVGLFFFGAVPGVDQEDIFRNLEGFTPAGANLRVTITGLPQIPGAPQTLGRGGPTGGDIANFLANITPAAGGEGTSPEALNNIDPAAGGGSTQQATCWGDAMGLASGGQAVSMDYGSDSEDILNSAAGCGSAI